MLSRKGVCEGELLCVQHQSLCCLSVESVSHDGIPQSLWVGTVHSQLVGSPREGM